MRAPTRFSFFITLGSGMLIAIALRHFKNRLSINTFRVFTISIIILILADFFPQFPLFNNSAVITLYSIAMGKIPNKTDSADMPGYLHPQAAVMIQNHYHAISHGSDYAYGKYY